MSEPASRLWDPPRPFLRALVVCAHPDDAEFGAAGTVARWVAMGTEVRYLVLTDGASGSQDGAMSRERLAALRQDEQRAACDALGVVDVEFVGHPDGFLEASVANRRQVAAAIRRHRPEAVVAMNPDLRWASWGMINHPDHRAAGDLTLHAVMPAASTRLYDLSLIAEGLEPWDVSEVWLQGFGDGLDLVDVTDHWDTKLAALRCHASQVADLDLDGRLRPRAAQRGAEAGVGLAEAFTVLRLRTLSADGANFGE